MWPYSHRQASNDRYSNADVRGSCRFLDINVEFRPWLRVALAVGECFSLRPYLMGIGSSVEQSRRDYDYLCAANVESC